IDPPGIIEIGSCWQDTEGVPHVIFEAGKPGKGVAIVGFEDGGVLFEMQTTKAGVVVANGFDVTGWQYICVSLILVTGCIGVLCASAAFSLWRRSWFGYEMAAYIGGAVFFLLHAIQFAVFFLSGWFATFSDFATAAITMMNSFIEAMAIPMAAIALFVSASNVVLLRREGRAFTNLLGVIATILWAAAFFGIRAFHQSMGAFITNPYVFVLVDSALAAVLAYALALFLGVSITALLAARHMPSFPRDYLIILGCGLRDDGTPTPLLAGRVDTARGFAKRQVEAGFDAPVFVPSGGQGSDEACSEAESMGRYIGMHSGARILLEDRSTTTRENMAFSAQVIEADAGAPASEQRVAFSTTNYHVLRGYVFAHMAGMEAEGIAAPTKLYFWPNAFLREFVGMLAARALPIAMNCAVIVALYGILEFLLITR
ncbi:MAG: YdcF family protein, partial [Atopobiaceae bacterium]|nr:YdcF family protein [Atopobiaceae bacterium]